MSEIKLEITTDKRPIIFTFDRIINKFHSIISEFPDNRTGSNSRYSMTEAAIGAFSVFFTQSPSFLSYQKAMEKTKGESNAQSLFGIHKTPCDNHIRDLTDEVNPSHVYLMFPYILKGVNEAGYLNEFRTINSDILIALDGVQYFSSNTICCKNCGIKKHKNGQITYSHSAVTPVIVSPGNNKVISLEPEFITPQDGHKKQDCETAAGKRWLKTYGNQYEKLKITILGDDLYSRQPMCDTISEQGFNFILVCKPESHKTLYEWLSELDSMGEIETKTVKRRTGKRRETDTYKFINQVPLRDGEDALDVNWCEMTTVLEDGVIIYKNSFITNHKITKSNIIEIVTAGRARWKIENENNNVLKNRGYNLKHNFGHGKKYLSFFLLTLNLSAFLFHTILDMMDKKYQLIRKELPTRKTFFDDIRALTRYILFRSWNDLLDFMMKGLGIEFFDSD